MGERGFEGYVDQVTEKLRALVPNRDTAQGQYQQFVGVIESVQLLTYDGKKFVTDDLVHNLDFVAAYFHTKRPVRRQVIRDLERLAEVGVLVFAPTFKKWRLSEAGRRAIGEAMPDAVIPWG